MAAIPEIPGIPGLRWLRRSIAASWRAAPPWQRLTTAAGTLLIAWGLAHLVVFAVAGGAWEGPVSWRKPVTFGISFGLTCVTLGWLLSVVRASPRTAWLIAGALVYSTTMEVAWVSLQRWRGVPSHFNLTTALDGALFLGMGAVSIAITVLVIAALTVLVWVHPAGPRSLILAARVGLLLLLVAQAVGVTMIVRGLATQQATGLASTIWGAAGVMKLSHFAGMHAVQMLPGLAWLLQRTPATDAQRFRLVAVAAVGYSALVGAAVLQTFTGRAPQDPTALNAGLAIAGLALLAFASVRTIGRVRAQLGPAARWL